MQSLPQTERLAAELRNAAWLVRHYKRGRNSSIGRAQRTQAIQRMGLTVRHAFTVSEEFEVLLTAIIEGLAPKPYDPPF